MGVTDWGSASLSSGNSGTVSVHDNVEVHTVNTNTWVVLDTQVNVLVNTETEVTSGREVSLLQLELLDSQTSLQDLLSLRASDGDVDRNLFVSSDTESSDGVSGLGLDWGLTGQLLQDLGGSGQSVTGLTDTDVQDQLLDTQLTHRVLSRLDVSIHRGDSDTVEVRSVRKLMIFFQLFHLGTVIVPLLNLTLLMAFDIPFWI